MPTFFRLISLVAVSLWLASCSTMISSATENMAKNLATAINNNDDLETVKAGAPAYLLMLDSFIEGDPENTGMLLAAAKLNGAYASVFVRNKQRAKRLTNKALQLALKASCLENEAACHLQKMPFPAFTALLKEYNNEQLELLFTLGASWACWIQQRSDDWNAVAELPRVKLIMQRVLQLQPTYQNGQAQLYMGVLNTLLPPALGGKVEQGRQHFEKAVALSQGKNLMAKVIFAEKYARLVFNQTLHDKLLKEVLAADPHIPGFTLTNMLAQKKARELLKTGQDYF